MVSSERLLCLHDEQGTGCTVFAMRGEDADYDPPMGRMDMIQGRKYRVIRTAALEPFPDGQHYWAVHAIRLGDTYH